METKETISKYINLIAPGESYDSISKLSDDINKIVEENKDLNDVDLLKKIEEQYGSQIELNEKLSRLEKLNSIKNWIRFIGIIIIIEIVAAFIWAIISTSAAFK